MVGTSRFRKDSELERFGLFASVLGHIVIGAVALGLGLGFTDLPQPVVYSVTIEGGKTLGGRSQAAKDDKKQPIAPPKNVSEQPKEQEKSEPQKMVEELKPQSLKEEQKVEEKNAVPIKEEPKVVPTPKPAPTKEPPRKEEPPKKEEVKKDQKGQKKDPVADVNKDYQKAMQRYLGDSSDARGEGFGAGKLGGNSMGGGEIRPREFFMYLEVLKGKIKQGWSWFDQGSVYVTVVRMSIDTSGNITSASISKSSGNRLFDDSVLRAVKDASPVPPPPANVYQYFRDVELVFDPKKML